MSKDFVTLNDKDKEHMKQRISYLDLVKGFAIILMLFAHTMNTDNSIHTWIFSFHMPIFFIISGVLNSLKYESRNTTGKDITVLINKRVFQLGVPYYIWSFALIGFYTVLELVSGEPVRFEERIYKVLTFQGIDSLWFIPCFFIVELLLIIVLTSSTVLKAAGCGGTLAVIGIVFFSNNMPTHWILRLLVKIVVCFVFELFGYVIGRIKLINRLNIGAAICMLILGSYMAVINGLVGIGALEFQNGLLFWLNSVLVSISVLALACRIESTGVELTILGSFGRNTIVVLCTNNLLIETIRLLDYRITGNFFIREGTLGCILLTVVLILIEIPLIKIANSKYGIVFGKRMK